MSTREVSLEGTPPWGFRMNGGADAGHPLRISRVNPGSKAESKGVREGDLLTSINGQSTKCLTNSESHALLRTVKENLRLGLNEDKNSSPRRRSKEIKSTSSTAADRELSEYHNQQTDSKGNTSVESVRPSSSKSRRQRRAKLKMKLKELLGYKETKGHVINLHPNLGGDNNLDKFRTNSEGPSSIQSDATSDNSSAILYDNYQDNINSKGNSLDREHLNNNTTEQHKIVYFSKSVTPPRNSQQSCWSTSNISNSSGSRTGSPLPVIVPVDEPKSVTVTVLKHNVQHGTINGTTVEVKESNRKTRIDERKLDEIRPDNTVFSSAETAIQQEQIPVRQEQHVLKQNLTNKHEAVEVLVTSDEEWSDKNVQTNVIVHHPDDICEESVKFLPPNDLTELSISLQPIKEDDTYDLSVNDLHTPLITHAEEKKLRSFLETLHLNAPEDIQTEQVKVFNPPAYTDVDPQMYYYIPKRHLDVISEETSDLSDVDKPGNNNETVKHQNIDDEPTREEWEHSYGGIDTSWRNGQSLEEDSDVIIVSDSHSDSDILIDECKLLKNVEQTKDFDSSCKIVKSKLSKVDLGSKSSQLLRSDNKTNTMPSTSKKVPPVTHVVTKPKSILCNKPPRKPTPPYEKPIPSVAIVKNVVASYYNTKSVSEQVNINTTVSNEIKVDRLALDQQISNNDVEIVYIDSSDSEPLSTKSANSSFSSIQNPEFDNEIEQMATNNDNKIEIEDNISIKNIIYDINQTVQDMTSNSVVTDKVSDCNSGVKQKKCSVNEKLENAVLNSNTLCERRFSYPISKNDVDITKDGQQSDGEDCGGGGNMFSLSSRSTESFSSQSTARHYYLSQVLSLKELCSNIVLSQPNGLEILKQLGIEYTELEQYSGYIPEDSECSTLSRNLVSEKELKVLSEDTENEVSVSQDLPSVVDPLESNVTETVDDKHFPQPWIGVPVGSNPELLICIQPSQLKKNQQNNDKTCELLDLHRKFIERRGYYEKSPVQKKVNELNGKETEEDTNDQFKALKKYHESRQEKMKAQKKIEQDHHKIDDKIKSVNSDHKMNRKFTTVQSSSSKSDNDELVLVYNVTPRKDIENKRNCKDNVKKDIEEVGTSRLLELIQNFEPESSVSKRSPIDESYPQLVLIPKDVSIDDSQLERDKETVQLSDNSQNTCENKHLEKTISKQEIKLDKEDKIVDSKNKQDGKQEKTRPKSLPPTGDVFRKKMYEEYMDKLAALAERRQMKIIKLSPTSSTNAVTTMAEIGRLESEFMIKVKERMNKLGISMDGDEDDDVQQQQQQQQQQDSAKILKETKSKESLPKHLQELMDITEECGGVWSPAQTPESERKKFDFTGETKREKKDIPNVESEPQPAVWTPKSAGASPTFERKYRVVNFQSPPPKRKEIPPNKDEVELPKELPTESSRLVTSASENSTLSTQLRLPPAQNPTITLLQKAREGQIPKGAQYLDESDIKESTAVNEDEIFYTVRKEYTTIEDDRTKKIVELSPRRFEGIGPITREGIPTVLRSEVKEDNQQKWYKRMYDSLHKADHDKDFVTVRYKTKRRGQYPFSYAGGYASEPERLGYDSDITISKYATLDRRKIRNKENDFTTSTLPRNKYSPAVKHALDIYKNQPGKIEDYEPGHSSIAEKETKQWWDEVLDIFDGELNQQSKSQYSTPTGGRSFTYALKDTGYDSDSTLVFKRRDNMNQLSPSEQKMAYKVIQRGGDVPLHGLRKPAPERPKESPHRYVESEVNIHYRSPIRSEAKAVWPEEELAERQAEIMRRIYQEQRRTKYLNELHDMYSRRHTDNFIPSQKSPIPLNRYDDFPLEAQPPRPRDRTPEPKLVARALYNFVGQTSRELSFRRGDIIYVRRQIDKNWYEGEHNAMIGLFPFNYVEIIPYDGIRTLPKKANEGQARAKFNFQAQTHLELSLVKGELVLLTRRVDENWFEGRIGSRKGIFPVSYVEVLVEPGERPMSPTGPISTKPIVAPASHSVMLNGAKDLGQQHYQPPRPALYSSSSLPAQSKISDISLVSQTLHIDTQSDPVPYRVLYNYKPQNDDELELKEGDVVYVMEKCDDGWYVGSLHRNGQFGTFPGNYVERIQ